MVFLAIFTTTAILVQCMISVVISWMTLSCKFVPHANELQEMTLMKLLYLHDPEACGRVLFYNHTVEITNNLSETTIEWPFKNIAASKFRSKMKVWLSLHLLWALFCVGYMTQGHRPCGLYSLLIPFTVIGVAIMVMDLVLTVLFLIDTSYTGTEVDILHYINVDLYKSYRWMNKADTEKRNYTFVKQYNEEEDTSWISLLFAYGSCRGVVQWVINYWIIKDNYFEGLAYFRRFRNEHLTKSKGKPEIPSLDSFA